MTIDPLDALTFLSRWADLPGDTVVSLASIAVGTGLLALARSRSAAEPPHHSHRPHPLVLRPGRPWPDHPRDARDRSRRTRADDPHDELARLGLLLPFLDRPGRDRGA